MTKKPLQFPEKLIPLHAKVVIRSKRLLGPTAEVFIHEKARKLPQYNEPITCKARGFDSGGKKIAINTVGRWLFGVPGFRGHVRIVPERDIITIYYPEQAPQIVHSLLRELKSVIEESNK
jgi:hypothetical protein